MNVSSSPSQLRSALEAAARLRGEPRIDEVDRPLGAGLPSWMVGLPVARSIDDVVVQRVEVQEVLLDEVSLVAEGDDEFVDTVGRRRCS